MSIPDWVMDELWRRARPIEPLAARLCRGTLISREQYLVDVQAVGISRRAGDAARPHDTSADSGVDRGDRDDK